MGIRYWLRRINRINRRKRKAERRAKRRADRARQREDPKWPVYDAVKEIRITLSDLGARLTNSTTILFLLNEIEDELLRIEKYLKDN